MRIDLRFLFGSVLVAALIAAPQAAFTQKTKSTLTTEVTTNFPTQNTGSITPAIAVATFNDFISSWQQAPQVRANTATVDTITSADYGFVVTEKNASTVNVTLPQATGSFATFSYYQSNIGAGNVVITPSVSTINGAANYTIVSNSSVLIVSDGTNWQIVGGNGGSAGAVTSVFGRSGVVTAQTGDYTIAQITNGLSNVLAQYDFFIGNGSNIATATALSGDCTYGSGGIDCTKTNGVAFAASATSDTTNAANITSGTLPFGRLSGNYSGISGSLPLVTGVGTLTSGATGAGFTLALGSSTITGVLPLANGGTNTPITASAGGIVYSDASALEVLPGSSAGAQCLLNGTSFTAPYWGSCLGGAAVSSVTAANGSLTVTPTTGAVVAGLNLSSANIWLGAQTFAVSGMKLTSSGGGVGTFAVASSASNFTLTFPAITDTIATLNATQVFGAGSTWNGVAITGSYIATNTVANANLAQMAANTWKGNSGSSTVNAADNAWTNCNGNNSAVQYTNGTGTGCGANFANLTVADQTLSGGANVTPFNPTAGNYTIDCGKSPLQWIVNIGVFSITAPSVTATTSQSCSLRVINGTTAANAGAVTLAGFSGKSPQGASFATTATVSAASISFTNSSANITWTANGLSLGTIVFFANSGGGLPTNFSTATLYYVVTTGTNTIQVSATPGGSAITAGSAGSGTQTGYVPSVYDLVTQAINGPVLAVWTQVQ